MTRTSYVILPRKALRSTGEKPATRALFRELTPPAIGALRVGFAAPSSPRFEGIDVLDQIGAEGAKLVSADAVSLKALENHDVRIVPVHFYLPALAPRPSVQRAAQALGARAAAGTTLTVVSGTDGAAIAGATVVAFTDFAALTGDQKVSDSRGNVTLAIAPGTALERLYVYPHNRYWGLLRIGGTLDAGRLPLEAIDLDRADALRRVYSTAARGTGRGVTVAVVDTGCGPHKDLTLAGGLNCTQDGLGASAWQDNGQQHGTHVAGIIAARGTRTNAQGLAADVTIRAYRVFDASGSASSFGIAKAIDAAVEDGCDLVNMSLGGGPDDDTIGAAMTMARDNGVVLLVAAGNDHRQPVSFPARHPDAVAVSAFGDKNSFPASAVEQGDVAAPFAATNPDYFIAGFSNVGPEIALTAPGVGIISTVPGDTWAVMDGTSMACPAATGAAACLLSVDATLLQARRDRQRSDGIVAMLRAAAKLLGFGAQYEGSGLLPR